MSAAGVEQAVGGAASSQHENVTSLSLALNPIWALSVVAVAPGALVIATTGAVASGAGGGGFTTGCDAVAGCGAGVFGFTTGRGTVVGCGGSLCFARVVTAGTLGVVVRGEFVEAAGWVVTAFVVGATAGLGPGLVVVAGETGARLIEVVVNAGTGPGRMTASAATTSSLESATASAPPPPARRSVVATKTVAFLRRRARRCDAVVLQ